MHCSGLHRIFPISRMTQRCGVCVFFWCVWMFFSHRKKSVMHSGKLQHKKVEILSPILTISKWQEKRNNRNSSWIPPVVIQRCMQIRYNGNRLRLASLEDYTVDSKQRHILIHQLFNQAWERMALKKEN